MPRNMKDSQRKAMFANMNKFKNKSFLQLQTAGIRLPPKGDIDGDGVVNIKDCKPMNKKEQGFIHDFIKKKRDLSKFKKKVEVKEQDIEEKQKIVADILIKKKVAAARLRERERLAIAEAKSEEREFIDARKRKIKARSEFKKKIGKSALKGLKRFLRKR